MFPQYSEKQLRSALTRRRNINPDPSELYWLTIATNMTELIGHARAGEPIPMPLRLRIRRDQVRGTGQAIRAVDRLFENSGGRALKRGTPIQRFWRDAHAGRVHAINDPERALSMFGRGEFGLRIQPDGMI